MKKRTPVQPPVLADKFLRWYCRHANIEDIHGDLEELFAIHATKLPLWKAKARYYKNVLSIICSYALRRRRKSAAFSSYSDSPIHPAMLKNYLIVATRNLARHKFFSIINIVGMAIGMSISLLLIAMLSFLWRYDDFHVNKDNIYRIISEVNNHHDNENLASAPAVLAEKLKNEYTSIEKITRINSSATVDASFENKQLPLQGYFTDPDFLNIFSFPLVKGNMQRALEKTNSIIITQSTSSRFFGGEEPMGKVIDIHGLGAFEITGIMKDIPKNSHLQFQALIPYEALINLHRQGNTRLFNNDWKNFHNSYVYLVLPENDDPDDIEQFLSEISREAYAKEKQFVTSFKLQSLRDIVPGTELNDQIGPSWGYASLGIFAFLTLMILLPACFNYTNISISRALKRMKEIGLRKVMGGQKNQIFFQFVTEAIIITLLALILSFGIFHVIREEFLTLLVGSEGLDLEPNVETILYFVLFAVLVGFMAGVIPAMYFSKLTPIQALKGKSSARTSSSFVFQKFLVLSQFALSMGFIMGVVIVLSQYYYTLNFDFGFNEENILDVTLQETDPQILKNEFRRLPEVETISMSSHVLGTEVSAPIWVKGTEHLDSAEVFHMFIDENYISNFGLDIISGNDFPQNLSYNHRHVMVNEEFLKQFKIESPSDAIGETYIFPDNQELVISGVLKNFHYTDLRQPVRPFAFRYDPKEFKVANIRVVTGDMFKTLTAMESTWKTFAGERKFIAKFFEDEMQESYSIYFSMIKICGFLALLAISISCLGLLGMVVFNVENRVKEIGIRKVMGATEMSVVLLLSKQFLKLMTIAAFIAVPFTWLFFENAFLNRYHYKIEIGITEVVVSVAILTAIGLTTILSQTIRAASTNPVESLRSE